MSIVWIASYPKSGNTLVRFLLHAYLYGAAESSGDIAKRIPAVDAGRALPSQPPRYLKTHYKWSEKHPFRDLSEAAITVIRHPRDVLLSAINHVRLKNMSPDSDEKLAEHFIALGGMGFWQQMGYGTWIEHVQSWREAPLRKLELRYEALTKDRAGALEEIVAFLKLERDAAKIAAAVEATSFEAMRDLEERDYATGRADASVFPGKADSVKAGRRFVNKGESGRRLDSIAPGLDAKFEARFAPILRTTGYTA